MWHKTDKESFSLKKVFFSWLPVFMFVVLCSGAYLKAHKKKAVLFNDLKIRYETLMKEKHKALSKRNDLKQQIESQNDPLWIEQTLMRGLGLVPDGQKKIIFREK